MGKVRGSIVVLIAGAVACAGLRLQQRAENSADSASSTADRVVSRSADAPIADPYVVRDDLVSPLTTFEFGGSTQQRWNEETHNEFAACMRAAGFDLRDIPFQPDPQPATVGELADFRAKYGYGIMRTEQAVRNPLPEATHDNQYQLTLDPETLAKYLAAAGQEPGQEGSPPGSEGTGCARQAKRAVVARHPRNDAAIRAVWAEYGKRSSQMAKPREAWAKCMADHGVPVAANNPLAAEMALRVQLGPPLPGGEPAPARPQDLAEFQERELKVAAIDFECWKTHFHPASIKVQREAFAAARVHADGTIDTERDIDAKTDTPTADETKTP